MKRKITIFATVALLLVAVVVCSFTLKKTTLVDCGDCVDGTSYAYTCVDCEGEGETDDGVCAVCEGHGGTEAVGTCETCNGATEVVADSPYYATFMSLMPALIAIVLALITKEVYSSLFIGIVCGALFATNFNPVATLDTILEDALIAAVSGTAGIFVFLVVLGILVALINKAGGSAAFGRWAATHIKSRVGASLSTFVLGVLIFIDDYFNCLTVGSVMRPVTDRAKISRAKLAYLIDATAAPICMIAPISSWAAAVSEYTSGVVDAAGNEVSELGLFVRAIPYNLYSLLTFVFIIAIVLMKLDYGPMRRHERNALGGDLFTNGGEVVSNEEVEKGNSRGRVIDLLLPILVLIVVAVIALVYVGGFFGGDKDGDFIGAFGNTDATVGLPLGGILVLVLTVLYFICRRLVTFKEAMACIPKGFIAMVPAILILTMATGLKEITGLLGSDAFVEGALANAGALHNFLPAIIFLVACAIAFATGTSWGTFGILIPIVLSVFPAGSELMIIGMSACLAGAVCGDHCSPISDTTIMSSAGAQCEHVNHVSTQLPYALTVAAVSFVGYILAGFVQDPWIVLAASAVLLVVVLFAIRVVTNKKEA
ncbi:MAG: Na+/H+ antiporter NhaC family protein [Ruminococcaceae bacterium]|nr:Na+/H+ antiporter NhaC family protein [Oscillospiraceae bacterium]